MSEKEQALLERGWTKEHASKFVLKDGDQVQRTLYRADGYWAVIEANGTERKMAYLLADAIQKILNG